MKPIDKIYAALSFAAGAGSARSPAARDSRSRRDVHGRRRAVLTI